MIDGYKGRGYGLSTDAELRFLTRVAQSTGIVLDPVYTCKGVLGMLGEACKESNAYRGTRLLFVHTGGVFGTYDTAIEPYVCDTPVSTIRS